VQQPFQRRLQQVLAVGAASRKRDRGAHEMVAAFGQQSLHLVPRGAAAWGGRVLVAVHAITSSPPRTKVRPGPFHSLTERMPGG
jgi:hypothetical protein